MEVKIGIQMAPKELIIETTTSAQDIQRALAAALADGRLFELADEKGRTILVPVDKIAYVELDATEPHRIGFGSS